MIISKLYLFVVLIKMELNHWRIIFRRIELGGFNLLDHPIVAKLLCLISLVNSINLRLRYQVPPYMLHNIIIKNMLSMICQECTRRIIFVIKLINLILRHCLLGINFIRLLFSCIKLFFMEGKFKLKMLRLFYLDLEELVLLTISGLL